MKVSFALAGILGCLFSANAQLVILNRTSVHLHDEQTGAELKQFSTFPGVESSTAATIGPDGDLYVTGNNLGLGSVLKFDGRTGAPLGAFVPQQNSGIRTPTALAFGTEGDLFISCLDFGGGGSYVIRFDGRTGAPEGHFIPPGGGLSMPVAMAFGADGNLYVADSAGIIKFNGQTGANMGVVYATPVVNNLPDPPRSLAFDAEGNFYVVNKDVRRVDASGNVSTVIDGTSAGLQLPSKFVIGPDGDLYVGEDQTLEIKRFNRQGESKGLFARADISGHVGLNGLTFTGPRMKISANANGGVTVRWPETFGRFSAQTRTDVAGNASWENIAGVRAGSEWRFETPAGNGQAVFRLQRE